jgi:hypothetical protein
MPIKQVSRKSQNEMEGKIPKIIIYNEQIPQTGTAENVE